MQGQAAGAEHLCSGVFLVCGAHGGLPEALPGGLLCRSCPNSLKRTLRSRDDTHFTLRRWSYSRRPAWRKPRGGCRRHGLRRNPICVRRPEAHAKILLATGHVHGAMAHALLLVLSKLMQGPLCVRHDTPPCMHTVLAAGLMSSATSSRRPLPSSALMCAACLPACLPTLVPASPSLMWTVRALGSWQAVEGQEG